MRKMKKLCVAMSMFLTVAVAAPTLSGSTPVDAAKKPKLSNTKLNMTVASSKTLKVKNYKKKVTWKSSKKSVARLSNIKKTSVKVTAKKKGKSKITATLKVGGKKRVLTCNVTVKPKNIVTPVPDIQTTAPTATTAATIVPNATLTPAPTATVDPNTTPTPAPTATVDPNAAPTPAPTATVDPNATPTPVPTATVDPNATPTPAPMFDYDNYANCLWKNPGAHIKDVFGQYFISGISTDLGRLRYGESAALVRYHFGSVTMSNESKMESIVNEALTEAYPDGMAKANVDNYYATNGQGKIILDYTTLEKVLSYCKANGLKLRYNALVWHSRVREYFFLQDYNWSEYDLEDYEAKGWDESNYHKFVDPETAKKRLEDYIDQIIEYIYSHGYGEVVYAYDVVNEATNGESGNTHSYYVNENATSVDEILSTSGKGPKFQTNGGVKTSRSGKLVSTDSTPEEVEQMMGYEGRVPANDSYWYTAMGPDYLYLSFLYAHNAVEKYYEKYKAQFNYTDANKPSLIYNDYNQRESDHIALTKYINTACNLVKGTSGVKYCNGIGLQSHSVSEGTQERMIKNIADAGLEVQITELDESEGMTEDAHASKMKKLYNIYKKYSKKGEYGAAQGDDYIGVTSVTQWGICDGDGSWHAQYVFQKKEDANAPNATDNQPGFWIEPKPAFYAILQAGGVEVEPPRPTKPTPTPYSLPEDSLKEYADFPVGAVITYDKIQDRKFTALAAQQFEIVTFENEMKGYSLIDVAASQATVEEMNDERIVKCQFDRADEMVQWAKDNGLKVRGHVLFWEYSMADAFFYQGYEVPATDEEKTEKLVDADTLKARMESYADQVIGHFNEKFPDMVIAWDVVNEAIDGDSSAVKDEATGLYLNNTGNFYKILGGEYIKYAFQYAKAAVAKTGKDIQLFYNDFNCFQSPKTNRIVDLIRYLNPEDEEKLLDCMGMEGYVLAYWPNSNDVKKAMEKFASLGVKVGINELSVRLSQQYSNDYTTPVTEEDIAQHIKKCEAMFTVFCEFNKAYPDTLTNVSIWALTDRPDLESEATKPEEDRSYEYYVFGTHSGLFTEDLRTKDAFDAVINVLKDNR